MKITPTVAPWPSHQWLNDGPQVYLIATHRKPKAADIDGLQLLHLIAHIYATENRPAQIWDLGPRYPYMPWRVVLAKLRRLAAAGYIEGCDCGCRGDWMITSKGAATLAT